VARAIAIFVELAILAGLAFSMLWAVRLALFDLWLSPKYRPAVTMALATIGGLAMIFLIVHLISFYPS
jgi:hypothetical protein